MESDVSQTLLNGRRVAELGRQREAMPRSRSNAPARVRGLFAPLEQTQVRLASVSGVTLNSPPVGP